MEEAQASPAGGEAPLTGGRLLSAISKRIVQIQREHYGRGPMKAKTYALDDLIVVVLRGSGFTPLEKTILDSGDPDRVVAMRHDFQRVMTKQFTDAIEELTGRKVVAFLSQAHVEPELTIEMFFLDRPLEARRSRTRPFERLDGMTGESISRNDLVVPRDGPDDQVIRVLLVDPTLMGCSAAARSSSRS